MPELPAMENFRRSIEKEALNKKIKAVVIKKGRVVRIEEKDLSKTAIGQPLLEATRHGKYVFARIGPKSRNSWLSFHCGMTGYFEFPDKAADPQKISKAKLLLDFGTTSLAFYDPRMFGHVELIENPAAFIESHDLGPDVLDVTAAQFQDMLAKSAKPLKAFFLDQSIMAGIGNVYADEFAFHARIDPNRKAKSLSSKEGATLYRNLIKIFKLAIRKKAYLDHWDMLPKSWLVHYRKEGAACPNCNGPVKAYKSGGRDGYWCPGCQH